MRGKESRKRHAKARAEKWRNEQLQIKQLKLQLRELGNEKLEITQLNLELQEFRQFKKEVNISVNRAKEIEEEARRKAAEICASASAWAEETEREARRRAQHINDEIADVVIEHAKKHALEEEVPRWADMDVG